MLQAAQTIAAGGSGQDEAAVFEGTIGKAAVVMELDDLAGGSASGRYFYREFAQDIPLHGTINGTSLKLVESPHQDEANLDLKGDREKGFSGTWRSPKGKATAVSLKPLKVVPPAISEIDSLYDRVRLSGLKLQKNETTKFGKWQLQWWTEPKSKIKFPRVFTGYAASERAKVNALLEAKHWDIINSALSCPGDDKERFEFSVKPTYLSDAVSSFSMFTSYYCGGAHPDFRTEGLTIDVANAKPLQLAEVLDPPGAERKAAAGESDARERLGEWLAGVLKKTYPKKVIPKDQPECDYTDTGVWGFPSWHLEPTGVYVGARFPRANRACDAPDWSVIPWAVVSAHRGAAKVKLP